MAAQTASPAHAPTPTYEPIRHARPRPCGRDPSKPMVITKTMLAFPRSDYAGVCFPWPVFPRGSSLKLIWAGREASRKWIAAMESGKAAGLDEVDFAVAVYDKTSEIYAYTREARLAHNLCVANPDDWRKLVAEIAMLVHRTALAKVREHFPKADDLLSRIEDDRFLHDFVLPAMDTQWRGNLDSLGGPLVRRAYDEACLDRYIPDPASLPPRHFVELNLDDQPDFTPTTLWLDAFGNECEPPVSATPPPKVTPPRPAHRAAHWSPGSTDTSSTATDTTGSGSSPSTSSSAFTLHDDSLYPDK